MMRLALDPARAAEEMAEFSRRMAQAASGLGRELEAYVERKVKQLQ